VDDRTSGAKPHGLAAQSIGGAIQQLDLDDMLTKKVLQLLFYAALVVLAIWLLTVLVPR
jgi:hypothetical protein